MVVPKYILPRSNSNVCLGNKVSWPTDFKVATTKVETLGSLFFQAQPMKVELLSAPPFHYSH